MHVVHAILSWITTIVFLPTFGAVMVLFDVAQRVAYYVFGSRAQWYVAGAVQWVLVRTVRHLRHAPRRRARSRRPVVDAVHRRVEPSEHVRHRDPRLAPLLELPEVHLEA
jgi:hypothetical protein